MWEIHSVEELAQAALALGYDRARCIERLRRRIERDQRYLGYRDRRGRRTAYDEVLAEDVVVTALVVSWLQQQGEAGSGAGGEGWRR